MLFCACAFLCSAAMRPPHSLGIIFWHIQPILVEPSDLVLRVGISPIGGLAVPPHCFSIVLWHPEAILVKVTDQPLPPGVPLISHHAVPAHGLGVIFRLESLIPFVDRVVCRASSPRLLGRRFLLSRLLRRSRSLPILFLLSCFRCCCGLSVSFVLLRLRRGPPSLFVGARFLGRLPLRDGGRSLDEDPPTVQANGHQGNNSCRSDDQQVRGLPPLYRCLRRQLDFRR